MIRTKKTEKLSTQMVRKNNKPVKKQKSFDGNTDIIISTGSTLLDLAISGTLIRGGGIPTGIFVEVFGPSGSGKTVLLSEIAGAIQRRGGDIMFHDPEARLNKQFAKLFDLDVSKIKLTKPDTVTEVFDSIKNWKPEGDVNGVFADSLAALSTTMEMENKEGDKMGMRRSKEFSEGLRKNARILAKKNMLMVASNQIRINVDPNAWEKYTTPGGKAVEFYASLRLRFKSVEKITEKHTVGKKEVKRVIGTEVLVEVVKSSIDKPYRTAPIVILFDYGIDDIRANLQFIKDHTGASTYTINGESLNSSIQKSIQIVERDKREKELKEQVIDLWEDIESKFESNRKPKQR